MTVTMTVNIIVTITLTKTLTRTLTITGTISIVVTPSPSSSHLGSYSNPQNCCDSSQPSTLTLTLTLTLRLLKNKSNTHPHPNPDPRKVMRLEHAEVLVSGRACNQVQASARPAVGPRLVMAVEDALFPALARPAPFLGRNQSNVSCTCDRKSELHSHRNQALHLDPNCDGSVLSTLHPSFLVPR